MNILHIECPICNKKLTQMNNTHLKTHNLTFDEFEKAYPTFPSKKIIHRQLKMDEYYKNPKLCKHCNKPIPFPDIHNPGFNDLCHHLIGCAQYCNHTCSNAKKSAESKMHGNCLNCNKSFEYYPKIGKGIYCSHKCQMEYQFKTETIPRALAGKISFPRVMKRVITHLKGYKCEICGIDTWNNCNITLQLDHIDGDADNNRIENLRLLCPNCHSQTETWGSKNIKNAKRSQYNKRYRLRKLYPNGASDGT